MPARSVTSPCTKVTRSSASASADELQPTRVGAQIVSDDALAVAGQQSGDPGSETSERAGDERRGHWVLCIIHDSCCWSFGPADAKRNAMKLATLRRADGSLTTAVVVGRRDRRPVGRGAGRADRDVGAAGGGPRGSGAGARRGHRLGDGRSPLDPTALAAPVQRPGKFLAVGLNYADHIAESGAPTPGIPDRVRQGLELRQRPVRRRAAAGNLRRARLRGRARFRDRHPLPSRSARPRARGDRRLRDRRRLHGPRHPAPQRAVDAREVVRHARRDRSVDRDR